MYEAYYKLHGKPFQLTPDPKFLFPSVGHKRAMSYLRYGLEQGEGFVVITGAVGTGKTLLIQTLANTLKHREVAMATIAAANLDEDDVLPAVASAFFLPHEGLDRETLYQELTRHLRSIRSHGNHPLLIVDEAQLLKPAALEVLRILSNLEIKGHALLQVFLVGQSELKHTFANNHMEQLCQRIIASCDLRPLGEKESESYILHRLRAVGWKQDPALSPTIFPVIRRASQGIPRKINLIMGRLLLYGYLEELHEIDCAAVATVLQEMEEELPSMAPPTQAVWSPKNGVVAQETGRIPEGNVHVSNVATRLANLLRQVRENTGLEGSANFDGLMRRLLLYGYLEESSELADPAVDTVLRELEEELPRISDSLESEARRDVLRGGRGGSPRGQKAALVSLEEKLNELLTHVRDSIRQREESSRADPGP